MADGYEGGQGYAGDGEEQEYPFSRQPKLRAGEAKVLKNRFHCGNRYFEACFKDQAQRCRDLYNGSHWPKGTRKKRHNPVINYLKYVVDTQAASLAHSPGDVDLKPLDELAEANLDPSRRALQWGARVSNSHRELKRALRDSVTYSFGVAMSYWRYEEGEKPPVEGRPMQPEAEAALAAVESGEGLAPLEPPAPPAPPLKDEPCIKRIDPRQFRVSPEADWVLEEAEWCGFVEFRPLDEVKADPRYRKGITRKLKGTCKTLKGYLSPEERGKKDEDLPSDLRRVELWHYYEKRRQLHIVFAEEHPEPLMVQTWYWQHGMYPFDLLFTPRLEDEFYTERPLLMQWEHMQQEINEANGQLATHRRRFNRKYLVMENALSKNAEKALEAGEDGSLITLKNGMDPTRAVYPLQDAQLHPEVYQSMNTALANLRTLSTLDQYEIGSAPTKRLTTSEVQAIQGAGGALQGEMQQSYELFCASVLGKVFALMQQYADRTRSLPIYDENDPNTVIAWDQWTKDRIQGSYDFLVQVGSTSQKNQKGQVEEKGFLLQSLQPYFAQGRMNPAPLVEDLLKSLPEVKHVKEIVSPPAPPAGMMPPGMMPPPGGEETGGGAPVALPPGGEIPPDILMQLMAQGGG